MNALKNNSSISDNSGFTLIELISVIVILGILAGTAIPKFVNLSTAARVASLESIKGTIESSMSRLQAVCAVYEECRDLPSWPNLYVFLPAYGQRVMLLRGYPEAGTLSREGEIHDLVESTGYDVTNPDSTKTRWAIQDIDDCYVEYNQMANGETFPLIELVNSGC